MLRPVLATAVLLAGFVSISTAQTDWNSVPAITHSIYQSVNTDGRPAYGGTFPVRLRGVVLNNTEDWLDPTPAYSPGYTPNDLGGQAEFFFQAVDLDGTAWDTDPVNAFGDAGGTAVWIGQNYGNLPFKGDPIFNYTDTQWTAELARLGLFGGIGATEPLRAGDLVEVRARGGLHYAGKFNINEQHSLSADLDFDVIVLERSFGLPDATPITLDDLKLADDSFIFDPTRQAGGEFYQSTRVELCDVWIESAADWLNGTDLTVTDGTRTFNVKFGLNASFNGTELFATGEHFNVTGILNQAAGNGAYGTDGYQLLAMNAGDFIAAVPIPGDFDGDGFVGIMDLNIVLSNWNQNVPAGGMSSGDGSGDGFVGIDDLNIILGNWNAGSLPPGLAVPQPAAMVVMVVGATGLIGRRNNAG
jgi:hypothetical protein